MTVDSLPVPQGELWHRTSKEDSGLRAPNHLITKWVLVVYTWGRGGGSKSPLIRIPPTRHDLEQVHIRNCSAPWAIGSNCRSLQMVLHEDDRTINIRAAAGTGRRQLPLCAAGVTPLPLPRQARSPPCCSNPPLYPWGIPGMIDTCSWLASHPLLPPAGDADKCRAIEAYCRHARLPKLQKSQSTGKTRTENDGILPSDHIPDISNGRNIGRVATALKRSKKQPLPKNVRDRSPGIMVSLVIDGKTVRQFSALRVEVQTLWINIKLHRIRAHLDRFSSRRVQDNECGISPDKLQAVTQSTFSNTSESTAASTVTGTRARTYEGVDAGCGDALSREVQGGKMYEGSITLATKRKGPWVLGPRWRAVSLLASHQCETGSVPGRVTPEFSHLGIVPDNAADRRVFSGISRFPRPFIPALLHTHLNHLIGSQDLAVKSRTYLFSPPLILFERITGTECDIAQRRAPQRRQDGQCETCARCVYHRQQYTSVAAHVASDEQPEVLMASCLCKLPQCIPAYLLAS
ncbi:hypothetical protein PR048_004428 [Dryococelus australis]|uniref:Uncharacterized protein n=1 Tax=Dryococelus australis TaxID=614101 RepID=A0ABQ9I5E9_9NEOP|nr:hypothetical protein PR048_004428 [Dryococelus australis]